MSSKIKKNLLFLNLSCFIASSSEYLQKSRLDSFVGRFIRRYSGDVQERAIKHAPGVGNVNNDVINC